MRERRCVPMACVHCALWECACRPAVNGDGVEERESERGRLREVLCGRRCDRGSVVDGV